MVKLRRSGLEALKLTLNCILESHAGSAASVGERNWKGTYTSYAMFSMDIILTLGEGGTGTWNGAVAPFSREKILELQPMACNSSDRCHPGSSGCVLRPLVIGDYLMEARSLCSDVQTGIEASGLQLIGYILLSVSGVISKPTKRCIHMLVRDCARS